MSAPSTQTGWNLIDQALASLPAGANPYTYVAGSIRDYYHSNAVTGDADPDTFVGNMSAVIGIYSLCFLACIFTMVIKYKHSSLWLFRLRSTTHGRLLTVNTTALFTLWSMIFVFFSNLYIGWLIAALKREMTPVPAQAIMAVIWLPMCLSLFTEGHGMAIAVYLSQPDQTFFGVSVHASVLNTIALVFYILTPVALVPYFALAAHATQRSYDHIGDFVSWLSAHASTWDGSSAFTLDATAVSNLQALETAGNDVAVYLGNGFKVFLFCILASALFFIPCCIGYLRLLRRQLDGHRSLHSHEMPSSGEKKFLSSNASKQSDRLEALATSYKIMLIEVACVLFCTVAYMCLNGWAGFWIRSIMADGNQVILQHCLFYYCFALFGTPVCFLVAYRSWTAYKSEGGAARQSRNSSHGHLNRSIEVTTTIHQDGNDRRSVVRFPSDKPFLELDSVGHSTLADDADEKSLQDFSQV